MNTLLEIADYTSTKRTLTSSPNFNGLASSIGSTKNSKAPYCRVGEVAPLSLTKPAV